MRLWEGLSRKAFLCAFGLLASGQAQAACSLGTMAMLPVTMAHMRPTVAAKINDRDATFVVDSGAFFSLISPGVATEYGLRLDAAPSEMTIRGIGGGSALSVATVRSFTLAGIPLNNLQFIVGGSEVGSAGLLGQNVLGIADVEYDLPHGMIRLMKPADCSGRANYAYWSAGRPWSVIPIDPRSPQHPHTIGTILLNGVKIRATFDTGASTSMISLAAAARAGVKPGNDGVEPGGYVSGIGRHRVESWIARFDNLTLDQEQIRKTRLRIAALDLPDTDMLIGADFFISHRIYVSNRTHQLFLTYEGGPIFDVTVHYQEEGAPDRGTADSAPSPVPDAPADAEGYSRRGAVRADQHDVAGAISDFTQAIAIAPREPRYRIERARVYLEDRRLDPAAADLDAALAAQPDNVTALIARAALRMQGGRRAAAVTDLDAAVRAAAPSANDRLEIGALYVDADEFDAAIAQFDLWIAKHPDDVKRAEALNGRCWAHALGNTALARALADCNAALRLYPKARQILDSRGLVHLRMGDLDSAIADYDAVLAQSPHEAWSLYGRALAELRKGQAAAGQADIAAATAIMPKLLARASGLGLAP